MRDPSDGYITDLSDPANPRVIYLPVEDKVEKKKNEEEQKVIKGTIAGGVIGTVAGGVASAAEALELYEAAQLGIFAAKIGLQIITKGTLPGLVVGALLGLGAIVYDRYEDSKKITPRKDPGTRYPDRPVRVGPVLCWANFANCSGGRPDAGPR